MLALQNIVVHLALVVAPHDNFKGVLLHRALQERGLVFHGTSAKGRHERQASGMGKAKRSSGVSTVLWVDRNPPNDS
jgi:hypothetical protein